ncbi:MAG: acetyl-CoA carboxylase biotin carboxyl carrier protein [Candidatus Acidiferrales bacterium]|jgi:acetyl-CoA carboxylase biotin carboxyl carrier protein
MKPKNSKKSSAQKAAGQKSSENKALAVPGVDLRQLEQLLAFMSQNGLEEFEYASGDLRIRLKKAFADPNALAPRALPRPEIVVPHPPAGEPPPWAQETSAERHKEAQRPPEPPAPAEEENLYLIKSPIVGTYYACPSPDAPSFVKVGDEVAAGQVVCIIEAMKLMNEIEAEIAGEVVRVFAENGQPVEYGEPLFSLRPAGKS